MAGITDELANLMVPLIYASVINCSSFECEGNHFLWLKVNGNKQKHKELPHSLFKCPLSTYYFGTNPNQIYVKNKMLFLGICKKTCVMGTLN